MTPRPPEREEPREVAPGVTVDPRVRFGRPTMAGTGVSTGIIADRFRGGDTVGMLASDYGLTCQQIEAALRWELLDRRTRKRRMEAK